MTGLVLADDVLVLYGFWELTSVTSFLLIGNAHTQPQARAAALQALLVTGAGALAMLAGLIVLGQQAGTYRLSAILADPPTGTAVDVALVLILLGAFTKSAQMPFHSWLPAAMVAPTPVSTYLHSATMVKAGVYLVARLAPAFDDVTFWRPTVVTVGVVTMIGGGLRALRRTDLKLLLADGTVSQLGLMIAVFGWGTPTAEVAGSVMLLAHGAFKAAAFMVVGIVDHQLGTRDVLALPRPGRGWRLVLGVAVVAAGSMAGVPLLLGFIAKEADFAVFTDQGTGGALALAAVVAGSALTVAYSIRFAAGVAGRLAPPGTAAPAAATRSAAPGVRAPGRSARRGHDPLRRGARSRRPARHRRGECTRTGDDGGAPRAVARPGARAVPVPARPLRRRRPLRRPLEGRRGARRRRPPAEGGERLPSSRCAASRPPPTASPRSPNPDRSRSTSA